MALTLSRRVGEVIEIGDEIQVVVAEISRGQVRLRIHAPRDTKIWRQEIAEKVRAGHWVRDPEPHGGGCAT